MINNERNIIFEKNLYDGKDIIFVFKVNKDFEGIELVEEVNGTELKRFPFNDYPSVLVIHLGILDKLPLQEKSSEYLSKVINRLREYFEFIVVTSGRGKPANVPPNTKFMLLSDVMMSFRNMEYPDKLGLIRSIMNIAGG